MLWLAEAIQRYCAVIGLVSARNLVRSNGSSQAPLYVCCLSAAGKIVPEAAHQLRAQTPPFDGDVGDPGTRRLFRPRLDPPRWARTPLRGGRRSAGF